MKTALYVIVALLVLCTSCATVEKGEASDAIAEPVQQANIVSDHETDPEAAVPSSQMVVVEEKPSWVDGDYSHIEASYPDGYVFGSASSLQSTYYTSLQSATTRANADLVVSAKSIVESGLHDSLPDDVDESLCIQAINNVEHLIDQEIRERVENCQVVDQWSSADGEVFVIVGCDLDGVLELLQPVVLDELEKLQTYMSLMERQARRNRS